MGDARHRTLGQIGEGQPMSDPKPLTDAMSKMSGHLSDLAASPTVFDVMALNALELRLTFEELVETDREKEHAERD